MCPWCVGDDWGSEAFLRKLSYGSGLGDCTGAELTDEQAAMAEQAVDQVKGHYTRISIG